MERHFNFVLHFVLYNCEIGICFKKNRVRWHHNVTVLHQTSEPP